MDANFNLMDPIGVAQHHDAITGTAKQYVSNDYSYRLQKGLDESRETYKKEIAKVVKRDFGLTVDEKEVLSCVGTQNDTIKDCPVNKN